MPSGIPNAKTAHTLTESERLLRRAYSWAKEVIIDCPDLMTRPSPEWFDRTIQYFEDRAVQLQAQAKARGSDAGYCECSDCSPKPWKDQP
jgi:hypothetical protein